MSNLKREVLAFHAQPKQFDILRGTLTTFLAYYIGFLGFFSPRIRHSSETNCPPERRALEKILKDVHIP